MGGRQEIAKEHDGECWEPEVVCVPRGDERAEDTPLARVATGQWNPELLELGCHDLQHHLESLRADVRELESHVRRHHVQGRKCGPSVNFGSTSMLWTEYFGCVAKKRQRMLRQRRCRDCNSLRAMGEDVLEHPA